MSTPTTEVAVVGSENEIIDSAVSAADKISRLQNPGTVVFSTIDDSTFAGRLATVAALQDTVSLNEHLGESIELANIVCQVIEVNAKGVDGIERKVETVRVILVGKDGTAYHSVSEGVLGAVQTFLGALGQPSTWPEGFITVTAVETRTRSGYKVMSLVPVV